MSIYPPQISDKFAEPKYAGKPDRPNGVGTAATFVCGSFVRFSIRTGHETKQVESARYQTNGCGFMVAAAEIIAEQRSEARARRIAAILPTPEPLPF